MAAHRPRVALVFGGQSTEHQISCLTAAGVAKAIDTERFDVHGIGISQAGTWHRMSLSDIAAMHTESRVLPHLDDNRPRASLLRDSDGIELVTHDDGRLVDATGLDVALSVLHGPYGEDGTIQGYFEMLGLPYVGSGVAASAIGMDKHLMKVALSAAGIPTGPYEVIAPWMWEQDAEACCERVTRNLTYPVFVKPARGGSSVGIVRVTDPDTLVAAVELARTFDPKVIVEQGFVGAREIECAVLGPTRDSSTPRVSLPGEIVVHTETGFYDFEAKYLPSAGQVDLRIPADLDADLTASVQAMASASFRALEAEGLSRVDTFVTPQGEVFVNEVNTMPGFTELSMFPSLWQVTGLDYCGLITDLIEQALNRPNSDVR